MIFDQMLFWRDFRVSDWVLFREKVWAGSSGGGVCAGRGVADGCIVRFIYVSLGIVD